MRKNITRLVVVGVAALTAAGMAGMAAGAPERAAAPRAAAPTSPATSVAAPTSPATPPAANQPEVQRESGIVMEGTGEIKGMPFMVTVYENSRYGNSVQVVLGDPGNDMIGYVESAEPFVVDGVLDVSVTVQGKVVTLHGTVAPTGHPENVVDSQQDAGERIITRGTHQALETDVTLGYAGAKAAVSFDPAFAYDLQVRKVQLYGN